MKRPANLAPFSFLIKGIGDREGVRVDLKHGPGFTVDLFYPLEVHFRQPSSGQLAGFHFRLKFRDRYLDKLGERVAVRKFDHFAS